MKYKIKYVVGRNSKFWNAIRMANSAPLWNCIVQMSWPINPKNKKSKLVIVVLNDPLFKVVAAASGIKFDLYKEKKHE